MHKDLRGNPIYIGQEVVYGSGGRYHHFGIHTVLGFTPKMVRISGEKDRTRERGKALPGALVALPYANTPTVVCVILPEPSGSRVLAIRRANEPGKGLLGLPGGYQMAGETWQQAGCREAAEEVGVLLNPERLEMVSMATDEYGNNLVIARYRLKDGWGYETTQREAVSEVLETLWVDGNEHDWAFPRHQTAVLACVWG